MKSVLLIGLGRFGYKVAQNLTALGHEVMAIDCDEEKVNHALSVVTEAQIGDTTDAEYLKTLGVDEYDLCIVAIGEDFQNSLETVSLLRELGAGKIVAQATRDVHEKFLLRNGADAVVYAEKQLAEWTAVRYTSDHVLDFIHLDGQNAIYELSVPEDWHGKTPVELNIRRKYDLNVLAVRRDGNLSVSVSPDTVFAPGDTVFVLGEYKNVQKCFKK